MSVRPRRSMAPTMPSPAPRASRATASTITKAAARCRNAGRSIGWRRQAEPMAEPAARVAIKTEIAVIGAGQAGLSSAYHLQRLGVAAGRGFVVLDQSPPAGGAGQYRLPSLDLNTGKPTP